MTADADNLTEYWCESYLHDQIFTIRPDKYRKNSIWPGMVGIEVKMMPFLRSSFDGDPRMLPLQGDNGLHDILREMRKENRLRKLQEVDGVLTNFGLEDGNQLTFEPGGQLEYSS